MGNASLPFSAGRSKRDKIGMPRNMTLSHEKYIDSGPPPRLFTTYRAVMGCAYDRPIQFKRIASRGGANIDRSRLRQHWCHGLKSIPDVFGVSSGEYLVRYYLDHTVTFKNSTLYECCRH